MPAFSEDDVLDYVVREAILVKVAKTREKQDKEEERKQFRSSHKDLRESANAAPLPTGVSHVG